MPEPIRLVPRRTDREPGASLAFSQLAYPSVLRGEKQQTIRRRCDPRIAAGSVVRADVIGFVDLEITQVIRKRLGAVTDEDAQAEGCATAADFRELWRAAYGSWKSDEVVTIIRFRVRE